MSSHHFVREGQEPALYIHDAIAFAHVAALLEWAPLVITRSSVLEGVLSWGIKVDVVLDENDFPCHLETISSGMPISIVRSGERQLAESLTNALDIHRQRSVCVVTSVARELITPLNAATVDYNLTILDPQVRWVAVTGKFSKWLPAQSNIQLHPVDKTYAVRGAVLNSDRVDVVEDGVVEVASTGIFWVGEAY